MVVLNPSEPLIGDQNSDSVVVKLACHNVSLVLTRDADWRADGRMLDSSLRLDLHSDVLKMGHHGSRYSSTEDSLDAVSPEVAVISCGYDDPYGHPHNETLQRLIQNNITYFRTDIHPELIDDIVATRRLQTHHNPAEHRAEVEHGRGISLLGNPACPSCFVSRGRAGY